MEVFGGLLVAVTVLIPVGSAFGLVAKVVLAVRRRAARGWAVPISERSSSAMQYGTRIQRADLVASAGAAVVLLLLGGSALVESTFDSSDLSSSEGFFLAVAVLDFGVLFVALASIPALAVLIVLQIRDREVLAAEASALVTRSGACRTIRLARTASACVSVVALTATAAAIANVMPSLVWPLASAASATGAG